MESFKENRMRLSIVSKAAGKAASGASGAVKKGPKGDSPKIDHKGRVFTYVLAQMASAAPPLGSQLGQIGVNITAFVKDFNLKTSIYKEGVPIPCIVSCSFLKTFT